MDALLKTKLEEIANRLDAHGFEDAILELDAGSHADLEQLLNKEIGTVTDEIQFKKLLQIRFLLRIIVKYGQDINRGLTQLIEYETDL